MPDFQLFKDRRPPGEPEYEHMGALLTDAVLQAGLDYEKVVHPKASRVSRDVEVLASGDPKKMARRAKNKWLGRNVVRKMYKW